MPPTFSTFAQIKNKSKICKYKKKTEHPPPLPSTMPPVNLVNQRISAFGGGKSNQQPQSPKKDYQGNLVDSGTQRTYNVQRVNNGNSVTTTTTATTRTMWHYSSESTSPTGSAVTNPAYMGMGFTQNPSENNSAG